MDMSRIKIRCVYKKPGELNNSSGFYNNYYDLINKFACNHVFSSFVKNGAT